MVSNVNAFGIDRAKRLMLDEAEMKYRIRGA
jgi:hypothetical protein